MLSEFFAALLPQRGNFFTFIKRNKRHHIATSHDELIANQEELADTPDVYYGTAAFGSELSPTTGEIGRLQTNVIARRCLHLDLDVGSEKDYSSRKEALQDLIDFQTKTGIKFSHIVGSGGGIHAYIAFNEDITGDQWKPLAKRFQALLRQEGVSEDPACTTDSARVLRAPGMLHSSGNRVKLLVSTGVTVDPLELGSKIVSLLDEKNIPAPEAKRKSINDDVLDTVEGPPKSIINVVKQCKAVAHLVKVRGNVEEPYWRAGLGIAKFVVEGFKAAEIMSMGHPEYDRSATQAKLDRWNTGPTSCQEFSKYCSDCKSCQHWGQIKSPIVKGSMTVQQVEKLPEEKKPEAMKPPAPVGAPWDGRIPSGFKVKVTAGQSTLMWAMPIENEDENGDTVTAYVDVPFTHDVFWFSQWADAEHTDDGAQVIMIKWNGDHSKSYTLEQSLLENQQKLREALASKSVLTTTHKQARRAMEEYTKAQIQRIRSVGQKPKINTRFGIRITDNGQLVAAQGDKVIYPNGEIREAVLGDSLKEFAAKAFVMPLPPSPDGMWGPEVWDSHLLPAARKHVEFMRKHFGKAGLEKLQLAAMMSLASPLMPFVTGEYHQGLSLPPNGFSLSLYSRKGGRGKTSIMKAAALAYGKPAELTRDQNALGSTDKARVARLTLLGSCPISMDEMGSNTAYTVANIVSAIANGASRERADVNGGLSMGSTWALSCVIAANKSQREMVAAAQSESSAIQYRMLELDVQNLPEFSGDEQKAFTADWADVTKCAGALGALIHRRVCEMGVDKANDTVMKACDKARVLLGDDQTSRFQYRALGAILALQVILKKDDLTMFDLRALVDEFKDAMDGVEDFVAETHLPDDELELLSLFLRDSMEHTLVTQNITHRSKSITTYDHPLGKEVSDVRVRHAVAQGKSYVHGEWFKQWANDKGVSPTSIIAKAIEAGVVLRPVGKSGVKRIKHRIDLQAGTAREASASVWCYLVNTRALSNALGTDLALPDNVVELKRPDVAPEQPEQTDAVSNA